MSWFSRKREIIDPAKTRFIIVLAEYFMDQCYFEVIESPAETKEQADNEGAMMAYRRSRACNYCKYKVIEVAKGAGRE